MQKIPSSQTFIITIVLAVLVLIALWFVIPSLKSQIDHVRFMANNYVTDTHLPTDQRNTLEQDIRDVEDEIKRGETKGSINMNAQYLRLGVDLTIVGRNDLALDAYTRAAAIDSLSFVPFANMGSAHEAAKNYEAAKDAYRQAISRAPAESSNYAKLAELYWYRLNEIAVARGIYIEGLVNTHQEIGLMRAYASFLEQTGYTTEALAYWQEILKKVPSDTAVKDRIKALTPPSPTTVPPTKK